MDFIEPVVEKTQITEREQPEINDKTEETVLKLESEIDQAYSAVETQFQHLWSAASKNASALQETYQLEEHKNQLLAQLNSAKDNINNRAKVQETLALIEDQLKKVSIGNVDLKNLQTHANSALDTLDAKLEVVEKQAGKYMNQFTSFFSNIVSVGPSTEENKVPEEKEVLFTTSLTDHNNYGSSRYDNELFKLHTTPSLYLTEEQEDEKETSEFDVDSLTGEISDLLKKYPALEKLMNSLVPVKIPYNTFWLRYFKQDKELKNAELKRKELLEKNSKTKDNEEEDDDEEFTWDDDEEED